MESKTCNKCKEYLMLHMFHNDSSKTDGKHTLCKKCKKENSIEYEKSERRKKLRSNYAKSDKAIMSARNYRENNIEKVRERYRAYDKSDRRKELRNSERYKNKRQEYLVNTSSERSIKGKQYFLNNREKIIKKQQQKVNELSDSYVAVVMGKSVKHIPKDVLETKRLMLQLKRELGMHNAKKLK